MDNKEVLVKLHFVTKYGVPISSYKVIKNYTLYKYLVTTHLVDKLYIDYSNEDCEIVDIISLFKNSKVVDDKNCVSSHDNIKHILLDKDIHQYNLFSLIDMTYSDTFGFSVESDTKFKKYSEFYKMFMDLTRKFLLKYSNKQDCPKSMNELLSIELGNDFNNLLSFLNEPIDNENNIMNIINKLNNKLLDQTSAAAIKEYQNNSPENINQDTQSQTLSNIPIKKDKVIISKNQHGFFTFKDLIFDMKTGFVTGKWNGQKLEYLTEEDINLCKFYNLKYIDIKLCNNFVKVSSNNTELNNTSIDINSNFKDTLNAKLESANESLQDSSNGLLNDKISSLSNVISTSNELLTKHNDDNETESIKPNTDEDVIEEQTDETTNETTEEQTDELINNVINDIINEITEGQEQTDNSKNSENEPNETVNENINVTNDVSQQPEQPNGTEIADKPLDVIVPIVSSNPNSIIGIIKPLDTKPSRGRRKISATPSVKPKK